MHAYKLMRNFTHIFYARRLYVYIRIKMRDALILIYVSTYTYYTYIYLRILELRRGASLYVCIRIGVAHKRCA